MRGRDAGAAQRMSDLFAGLAASSKDRLATLWQLAAAVYEAQAKGLLKTDLYSKRLASRLLAQLRAGEGADPSDRLAQDLLFFCAQAVPAAGQGSRAASGRGAQGIRTETQLGGRLRERAPGPLRPLGVGAGAQTRGGRQGRVVGGGRRRQPALARPGRTVRAGWRVVAEAVSRGRDRSPSRCCSRRRTPCMPAARSPPSTRWRWPPACSISTRRSKTRTSTIPSWRVACCACRSGSMACARAIRPARSRSGWKTCTAGFPTARRWAAWCRSCAPRCRKSKSTSTSSSATRCSAKC